MAASRKNQVNKTHEKALSLGKRRISGEDLPRRGLEKAIESARILHATYAGKSATMDEIAQALEVSVTNTNFKYNFWAALGYGIISKEENNYSLSETGRKIVAPTYENEDSEAKVKAILTPTILSRFYKEYDKHQLPVDTHLLNVLETRYDIPRNMIDETIAIIKENAKYCGITKEIDGHIVIDLSGSYSTDVNTLSSPNESEMEEPELKTEKQTEWTKTVFFITPIGDDNSDIRKHSDMMLKHLLKPVFEDEGFEVVRADKIEKTGLITKQIFEYLVNSRLCVVDLSFSNPNVFYELGVRHMTKLHAIQIIRKGDKIPFDVSQGRTIVIDTSDVYTIMDRIESGKRELKEHVKSLLGGQSEKELENNPVSIYLPGINLTRK